MLLSDKIFVLIKDDNEKAIALVTCCFQSYQMTRKKVPCILALTEALLTFIYLFCVGEGGWK